MLFSSSAGVSPGGRRSRLTRAKAVSVACQSAEAFEAQSLDLVLRSFRELVDANPFKHLVVGLSGGSTPGPLYAALRQAALEHFRRHQSEGSPGSSPRRSDSASCLDLSRVSFFLVDERYVPPTDARSNVRLVMEELFGQKVCSDPDSPNSLKFKPTDAAWPYPSYDFYYPDTSLPVDQCIEKYREVLSNLLWKCGGVDLVLLGMGDDGHIASIFPPLNVAQYEAATCPRALVVHTTTDRFDVHDRISVTLHLLSGASRKIFLIKGESKLDTWLSMEACEEQSPLKFPALEVITSGGAYVVSFPSIDDFSSRRRKSASGSRLEHELSLRLEKNHLAVVVFGASGDLAKKKT